MKLAIVVVILLATLTGAVGYGRRTRKGHTLSDWAVGGRSLGAIIFWFMNAGEVYTTFAVLGISGYAWALGAPAYLAFCSVSMSYAIGYWLMPKIWRAGRTRQLVTQADFFAARYDATWLGVLTGVIGIASLIVYVQIQLVSLGLIVQLTLDDLISTQTATLIAGLLMITFVFVAGIRSAAFAAGVKDVLMIVVVVLLSATVAGKVGAASMLDIFRMAEVQHPGIGRFPGLDPTSPTTAIWLMTSSINIALGNWVFPHLFQMSYTAQSATAIRRNAIWQPLYSLAYFFIILLGFAALLAGTHPPGNNLNAALLQFISQRYSAPIVGLVAGTGFLLALAPGALLLLTAGSIFSRNVVAPILPGLKDATFLVISRG
jgi:SSS family solute:Na+ symporter